MKRIKKFSLLTASVVLAGSLFSEPVLAETIKGTWTWWKDGHKRPVLIDITRKTGTTAGGSAKTTATAEIKGGSLTLNGNLSPISLSQTLNGSKISTNTDSLGSVDIIDARGTGAGYSLTASATALSGTHGNVVLTPGSVAKKDATSDATPALVSGAQTLTTNPTQILTAGKSSVSEGKGSYTVDLGSLQITNIPANAYAGSYSTTVTFTLNAAPTGQE